MRELAAAGMEIGSHSATHVRLAGLDAGQLEAEVSGSRASLGELIGAPVRGFAYPYGSMDAAARRAVRDAGYDYACAVETPMADLGLMALPRIYVGQHDGAARLTAKRFLYRGYIAVKGRRLMKVLHVITGLDVGGAEIQLALILKYTRHDTDVVTLYNPGPVADQIRARRHERARSRHATQYRAERAAEAALDHRRGSLRRGAHAPVPERRSTPARRPGWPGRRWC